ncbi:Hint domain-containing protein [Mameliella sp.]|uniref:Hint domain-containing protein n=1 Tax=Mameliella sp. TaxID=1924940 RepID=UPI003BA9F4CE
MASFQAGFSQQYSGTSGVVSSDSYRPYNEALDDGEGDGTFEVGDSIWGTTNPFQGTVEVALVAGGTMRLPVSNNSIAGVTRLWFPESMSPHDFVIPATLDYATFNTSAYPTCFLEGTAIDTPDCAIAVQDLDIGQVIDTPTGTTVVRWIGRQTVFPRFNPAERVRPVRIAAGALGSGLPRRDLLLTADHALHLDGMLVNASALVNGETISWEPIETVGDRYTVYHVETEGHELILAEGAEAESYIDYVARRAFDNHDEYLALYGEDASITEMERPRISCARLLPQSLVDRFSGTSLAA